MSASESCLGQEHAWILHQPYSILVCECIVQYLQRLNDLRPADPVDSESAFAFQAEGGSGNGFRDGDLVSWPSQICPSQIL